MGSRQTESADGECPSGRDGDCGSCPRESSTNRRLLLKSVAAGGTLALAGCAGLFETEAEEEPDNYVNESLQNNGGDTGSENGNGNGGEELFSVEFLRNEATLDISGEETILDAGQEAELDLPYQCEVGVCGQCESSYDGNANEVVDMEGNQYLDDEEIENGALLTCVSTPKTDFEFEPATE